MPGSTLPAHYPREALERRAVEQPKDSRRSPFARDRARVLHAWSLRRLADKTQVLMPGVSDFPRTRLTHTLEVAQIAREMGAEIGCDPDLVDTAGLCHDLGHPPFGHNGEAALDAVSGAIGGFEGNAQSFRVLTRLEPKVFVNDQSFGLNLTRAALDSTIKYPWVRQPGSPKFNVYAEDLPAFEWARVDAPGTRRCLEAQVMDWADDVAYSVHDIEDALYAGYLDPAVMRPGLATEPVVEVALRDYAGQLDEVQIRAGLERLSGHDFWPGGFSGSQRALAALKQLTSTLIGRYSQGAACATRAEYGAGPLIRYQADLVIPEELRAEVAVLKSLSSHFVFHREGTEVQYAEQRRLLIELVEALMAAGEPALAELFVPAWQQAANDDERLRVVIDHVASLTDVSAVRWHNRLCRSAT